MEQINKEILNLPAHPNKNGYLRVFYNGRIQKQHRLIMEFYLISHNLNSKFLMEKINGIKTLRRDIIVHHINGNKSDNRLENLQCLSHKKHSEIHLEKYPNLTYNQKQFMWRSSICPNCKGRMNKYSQFCMKCFNIIKHPRIEKTEK